MPILLCAESKPGQICTPSCVFQHPGSPGSWGSNPSAVSLVIQKLTSAAMLSDLGPNCETLDSRREDAMIVVGGAYTVLT
jgi:hypothetical protein